MGTHGANFNSSRVLSLAEISVCFPAVISLFLGPKNSTISMSSDANAVLESSNSNLHYFNDPWTCEFTVAHTPDTSLSSTESLLVSTHCSGPRSPSQCCHSGNAQRLISNCTLRGILLNFPSLLYWEIKRLRLLRLYLIGKY